MVISQMHKTASILTRRRHRLAKVLPVPIPCSDRSKWWESIRSGMSVRMSIISPAVSTTLPRAVHTVYPQSLRLPSLPGQCPLISFIWEKRGIEQQRDDSSLFWCFFYCACVGWDRGTFFYYSIVVLQFAVILIIEVKRELPINQ